MRYIRIPADINVPMSLAETSLTDDSVLEYFQAEVGGYVEQVRLGQTLKRNDIVMLVDEEGARKSKTLNSRASALYGMFNHGGVIFGDAVLVGLHHAMTEDGPEEEWWSLPGGFDVEYISKAIREQMPKGS